MTGNHQSYSILTLMAIALMAIACGGVDEDERLINVEPGEPLPEEAVTRRVLIEDFTGQRCVNCPYATDEINRLEETYGEDNVIAVAIHSGPLGFYTNAKYLGLKTEEGDDYFNHWNLDYQPVGMVNRSTPTAYTTWSGLVHDELLRESSLQLDCTVVYPTENAISLEVEALCVGNNYDGHLQIWLVEDFITAFQMMPDGTRNDSYMHRHVFRSTVNGLWGDAFDIEAGETFNKTYSLELSPEWNTENLSVVVFAYGTEGVEQVIRTNLQSS